MLYSSIDIIGGLGNHLFQIAFLIFFNRKSKEERSIVFKYEENLHNSHNLPRKTFWNTLFKNQFNVLNASELSKIQIDTFFKEQENHSYTNNLPYDSNKNIHFQGYFQSFSYIDDEVRNIMQNIVFSNKELLQITERMYDNIKSHMNTNDDDIVSIHFRRTDYVYLSEYHCVLAKEYYKQALERANKKNLIIFSDDIEWCKQNINKDFFSYEQVYFVENNTVEIDFLLMTKIKHNIIANSTFSLWASFLSDYENKIIIAPKIWYGINGPKNHQEIYHKYITYII